MLTNFTREGNFSLRDKKNINFEEKIINCISVLIRQRLREHIPGAQIESRPQKGRLKFFSDLHINQLKIL